MEPLTAIREMLTSIVNSRYGVVKLDTSIDVHHKGCRIAVILFQKSGVTLHTSPTVSGWFQTRFFDYTDQQIFGRVLAFIRKQSQQRLQPTLPVSCLHPPKNKETGVEECEYLNVKECRYFDVEECEYLDMEVNDGLPGDGEGKGE